MLLISGVTVTVSAEELDKKPLNEVFNDTVIIPFDYHGKGFIDGRKTDVYGEYQMIQRNGRVLVPIRLMGYLATQSNRQDGYWEVIWQPQQPDDVLITNYQRQKTIKFTVGSHTMLVNNEPQTLDVAPQKLDGRIVLPLRSAASALDKKIEWLDGLILISDEYIDLQHPQTLAIKERIKDKLTDGRKRLEYDKSVTPIAKYGDTIYFSKRDYSQNHVINVLYKQVNGQKAEQIVLPEQPVFYEMTIIKDELYFISTEDNQSGLYVFNFANEESRKVTSLEQWSPQDGWLSDVMYIDNQLYINLHYGDMTMGSEQLYRVDSGILKPIVRTKSLIGYAQAGEHLYVTEFSPMGNAADNLKRVNLQSGEQEWIGEPGNTYGINRNVREDGAVSYGINETLTIKDGYLYTLGYKESDLEDKSAVYKINLAAQTQVKLTASARQFWIEQNQIYYIESESGHLKSIDINGENVQPLTERNVVKAKLYNGYIYYTAVTNGKSLLYQYDISKKQEIQLSNTSVHSFYAGEAGVYYVSQGYDLGLYKVDTDDREVRLIQDSIDSAKLTGSGILYTLVYEEGIYLGK